MCCDLFEKHLKCVLRSRGRGLLSSGLLLQFDNVQAHVVRAAAQQITHSRLAFLPHLSYSPELAPCGYYVFGPFKEALS